MCSLQPGCAACPLPDGRCLLRHATVYEFVQAFDESSRLRLTFKNGESTPEPATTAG